MIIKQAVCCCSAIRRIFEIERVFLTLSEYVFFKDYLTDSFASHFVRNQTIDRYVKKLQRSMRFLCQKNC